MAKIHNISVGHILFFRFFQVANRSLDNATNWHTPTLSLPHQNNKEFKVVQVVLQKCIFAA